jgi:hypothetical protein
MVTSRRPASIATPVRAVLALAELRGQEGMVDWLEFIHV